MSYTRPTLTQLRQQARGFFSAYLPGADSVLRRSVIGVIADCMAGLINGCYGYLDWIARQAVPWTATKLYLVGWASLKGVTRKPAAAATGAIAISGTATQTLTAGARFVRSDGAFIVTTADATIGGGGTANAPVVAEAAGAAGNTPINAPLTLNATVAGISSAATVSTALTGGVDAEDDAALRSRMLEVYAKPPQGGALGDYEEWALQVAGVTRAWCVPNGAGVGTVWVYFMMDVLESAFGGFPQGTDGVAMAETRDVAATGDQLTVANYIYPLRPVTALVYLKAPVANVVAFTIANISGVSTAIKNAIAAAIDDIFLTKGVPGGTVYLSDIEAAIAAIDGTEGFIISIPAANIVSAAGHLPQRGVVTYT